PAARRGTFGATNLQKDYSLSYGGHRPFVEDCCPERADAAYNGMGWINSKVKMADVSDGTSNTFLVLQKANFSNQNWCPQGMVWTEFMWVPHQPQGLVVTSEPPNWPVNNSRASEGPHTGGGVMASYVDGHVGFVPNAISLTTYMALGTRNGGDIPGSD